jgi:hypothetical protein
VFGRLGALLQGPQVMLDARREGPATDLHQEAGPAVVRVEGRLVDHARAAGKRLEPPAELAAEPGAHDTNCEA